MAVYQVANKQDAFTAKVTDRKADVVMAAWNAAEALESTDYMVALGFLTGVLSHQLKKHVIDGNRTIICAETPEEKVEEFEFELNEVYSIDIVMSTGEGRGKETEIRNTIYKRAVENMYSLKTQKARQFISEVQKRFPVLPFTLRAIEDEQVARVGVSEARRHELLDEYPVLKEANNEFVAQFKFTLLLLPGGTKKITGLPLGSLQEQAASSLSVVDEEMKKLLATSANPKKAKKKKDKGYPGEGEGAAAE
ncbi:unnamed protein product [Durusdinium trenchii]|uniref:Uncharacterized protein n=1 Tax=Durusdinium trenchii TaxID=1381693 RepID=A0ABP0JHA1_9DINO